MQSWLDTLFAKMVLRNIYRESEFARNLMAGGEQQIKVIVMEFGYF